VAYELDPTGLNAMYHLLHLALIEGRGDDAGPLLEQFSEVNQAPGAAAEVAAMERCTRDGMSVAEWANAAAEHPSYVLDGAALLASGGRNQTCAEGAFQGLLMAPEGVRASHQRRALLGLQGVLRSQGRDAEALAVLDAATHSLETLREVLSRGVDEGHFGPPEGSEGRPYVVDPEPGVEPGPLRDRAHALMMVQAGAGWDLGSRTTEVTERLQRLLGDDWENANPTNFELYRLALVEASRGNVDRVSRIAESMEEVADTSNPLSHDLARAIRAHEALARGDSARALTLFRGLRTEGSRTYLFLSYADPLPFERIQEARLLLARGDRQALQDALDIASTLDGFALGYIPYLALSLEIRIEVAQRIGQSRLEGELRARLDALRASGTPGGS